MQLSSGSHIPDGLLAAIALRNENSRLGVPSKNPALHQGIDASNSTIVLGLQSTAALNRVGSRCTGKERDGESGNDYFEARYYSSAMGRFMSPDWGGASPVPYASFGDPQTLNLYSYMRNNPLGGTDPDGHCDIGCQISIALGIVNGIGRDGGVGPYTHNVGVGALKGVGQAAYTLGSIAVNGNNPGALASNLLNQPAALTPSNTTQAQAAFIASTTVTVAATLPVGPEVEAAEVTAEIPQIANEGIYDFTAASGKTYVGQSGDIPARIDQHLASGKLLPGDASSVKTTEVLGGKTAREIAEQQRINQLGGVQNLENVRNPIGPARQNLMPPNQ
jgi:RHS repeat-associated protein